MKPVITFVNHASYIVTYGDMTMICDPWLWGRVFNESWDLLTESKFTAEDFARVTHLWFSHEHPDHFSPPVLLKIPAEIRARITVVYHETRDRKVHDWCLKNGFAGVIELPPHQWTPLLDGVRLMCGPSGDDSWLIMEAGGTRILNVNDCVLSAPRCLEIQALFNLPVDVLFTQFSYASYVGDPQKPEIRQAAAERKKGEMSRHIEAFKPRYVVPFASFVWFCHEENFYLNDHANRPGEVHRFLQGTTAIPVLLYPGDEWEPGADHDSERAAERYEQDRLRVLAAPALTPVKPVSLGDLSLKAKAFRKMILDKYGWAGRFFYIRKLRILLTDSRQHLTFGIHSGIKPVPPGKTAGTPDLELSGGALAFCLSFAWGFNTLAVAGGFRATSDDAYYDLWNLIKVADGVNHNYTTWTCLRMSIKNAMRSMGLIKEGFAPTGRNRLRRLLRL